MAGTMRRGYFGSQTWDPRLNDWVYRCFDWRNMKTHILLWRTELVHLFWYCWLVVLIPIDEVKGWFPAKDLELKDLDRGPGVFEECTKCQCFQVCHSSQQQVPWLQRTLLNHFWPIDVLFPLVGWWIEGFVYPFNNRQLMIDGIPVTGINQPPISMAIYGHFFSHALRSQVLGGSREALRRGGAPAGHTSQPRRCEGTGGHPMRGGAGSHWQNLRLGKNHRSLGWNTCKMPMIRWYGEKFWTYRGEPRRWPTWWSRRRFPIYPYGWFLEPSRPCPGQSFHINHVPTNRYERPDGHYCLPLSKKTKHKSSQWPNYIPISRSYPPLMVRKKGPNHSNVPEDAPNGWTPETDRGNIIYTYPYQPKTVLETLFVPRPSKYLENGLRYSFWPGTFHLGLSTFSMGTWRVLARCLFSETNQIRVFSSQFPK